LPVAKLYLNGEFNVSKEIPVYCIESFHPNEEEPAPIGFDFQLLEVLAHRFKFTNRPHRHDFYNLLLITAGTGRHTIDFVTYKLQAGSFFFLSPGQVHSWELSPDIRGYTLFFKPDFFLIDRSPHRLRDLPFYHSMSNDPTVLLKDQSLREVVQLLESIRQEYLRPAPHQASIIRAFLEILLLKLSRFYDKDRPAASSYVSHQVSTYETLIDHHFREAKNVKDYAEMMNLTPRNLGKICKKSLNKTATELIQERIILETKRLLLHSDLTVKQIVDDLQFKDDSYFVKYFKKATGTTPEQFRQEHWRGEG
ncbi:MAG: helix-turn-helix transcriptional regulator, partial [Bacteroidota bacterium]